MTEPLTNLLVGGKHAQAHISNLTTSWHFYQVMLKHVLIHSPPEVLKFTFKSVIKIFQSSCIRMAFNYLVPLHCINACSFKSSLIPVYSACKVNFCLAGGMGGALSASQHYFCFQTNVLSAHLENNMSHQAQVIRRFISSHLEAPFSFSSLTSAPEGSGAHHCNCWLV